MADPFCHLSHRRGYSSTHRAAYPMVLRESSAKGLEGNQVLYPVDASPPVQQFFILHQSTAFPYLLRYSPFVHALQSVLLGQISGEKAPAEVCGDSHNLWDYFSSGSSSS